MIMLLLPIILSANHTRFSSNKLIKLDSLSVKLNNDVETNIYNDRWISVDKGYHFVGSLISTTGITNSCIQFADIEKDKSLQIGVGFTFVLSVGKEMWDSRKRQNIFSWKDLSADLLGIIVGSILMQIE